MLDSPGVIFLHITGISGPCNSFRFNIVVNRPVIESSFEQKRGKNVILAFIVEFRDFITIKAPTLSRCHLDLEFRITLDERPTCTCIFRLCLSLVFQTTPPAAVVPYVMYFSSDTPVRFLTLRRIKRPFASIYNILLNVALVICTDDILNREILSVEGSIALVGQG